MDFRLAVLHYPLVEELMSNSISSTGSLHSGNVCVLQGGRPYLLDLENYFFGGSAFLRHYAVMLRGPSSSLASFDIYSFGHILFEMATGLPLQQPNCDGKIPDHLPDSLSKYCSTNPSIMSLSKIVTLLAKHTKSQGLNFDLEDLCLARLQVKIPKMMW